MTDFSRMPTLAECRAMFIDDLVEIFQRGRLSYAGEIEFVRRRSIRDAILDLAEQLDAEGLVVVPRTATDKMLVAAYESPILVADADSRVDRARANMGPAWTAFLAATPLPASPSSVEGP